jgi:NAD(P)-dependent dehydrogenase (short-subunit alcohol dehydrogenase family)
MQMSLDGAVALVTGGGRGIGRAHSMLLAAHGARVLVCDLGAARDGTGRDASVARDVVAEIVSSGGDAVASDADISDFAGGAAAVGAALDAFGRLDIVVNNAGLAGAAPGDDAEEALSRALAVNFIGTVGVTRAAWPALVASGRGRVINTVSEASWPNVGSANVAFGREGTAAATPAVPIAEPPFVGYGASKAAVWSATLSLAAAGAPQGITVNAISPGAFTRMNEDLFRDRPPPPGLDLDPLHVARVVVWLATEEAADVTGRVIHAAGGHFREYLISRTSDTELVARLERAMAAEDASREAQLER